MSIAPAISTTNSLFGPMISGADVEDHLQQTLRRWLPTYVYEVERLHNLQPGTLPPIRAWVRSSEVEKMAEDSLPAIMIGSPGLTDPPLADADGDYLASWRLLVGIEIAAAPPGRALELARWYALALRACALQQQQDPDLSTPVKVIELVWASERYDTLDSIDDRSVCVGVVELRAQVAQVTRRFTGPLDPLPPDPNSPVWGQVTSVDVAVDRDPLE